MDIRQKVKHMTLEEKIGQKIMLDFRYWDQNGSNNQDMAAPDETIGNLITDSHIGGVIYAAGVDAAVAAYSYYGYDSGPSIISLAEILTNKRPPQRKLPVNTWHDYDVKTNGHSRVPQRIWSGVGLNE
ncbi:MAG: beta-hexosaminidase [Proteobacteria bacterium]|nr:beta-hexosaminidase [Pseudomonadota bacterium]